jgi:multicomponent Na+:H+ antiporter subunit B
VIRVHDSVVVRTLVRMLVPPIQLFALYVVFHGHGSPGGGFQGGVVLAATYVLIALALGREELERRLREGLMLGLGVVGLLVFALTGALAVPLGRALLDYEALPGLSGAPARALGILLIEIGVALAVSGTIALIFCRLAKVAEGEGDGP